MAKALAHTNRVKAAASGDVGAVMKLLDVFSTNQSQFRDNSVARINARDNFGQTALHLAVDENNIVAIQTLVGAGADVNCEDTESSTPLQLAVRRHHLSCVSELIKLGASVNCVDSTGRTALILAAERGREDCLQRLIEAGADLNLRVKYDSEDLGKTALMFAAKYRHVNCLKLLLEAGADVNVKRSDGKTALMIAAGNRDIDCLKLLLRARADVNVKSSNGKIALHYAYTYNRSRCSLVSDCMKILINTGSDITATDRKGRTFLTRAARDDFVHFLSVLVKAGAVIDQQDSRGKTALAHAVSRGSHECVRWLIDHGASVNICDHSGKTLLHYFMFDSDNDAGARQCLEILLSKLPNVNATDKDGMTPLMYVARKLGRGTSTMAMLLEHGAEINLVDNLGQTALIHSLGLIDLCDYYKDTYGIRFLINKGGNLAVGRIASGQLSRLALLDLDLDLTKLQVGSTVDMKAPWERFIKVFAENKRRILQFLIINRVVPSQPSLHHKSCPPCGLTATSLLECAALRGQIGIIKYLIATCYLHTEDFTFPINIFIYNRFALNIIKDLRSQPLPLVKLCFVAVSSVFGASPGRQERVKNSQLPVKLQKMLLFQEPWSRLCVHQWNEIPLTFSPDEYEKLPRPRPLLYHWPVGRALVPCDCVECDGTMYTYT